MMVFLLVIAATEKFIRHGAIRCRNPQRATQQLSAVDPVLYLQGRPPPRGSLPGCAGAPASGSAKSLKWPLMMSSSVVRSFFDGVDGGPSWIAKIHVLRNPTPDLMEVQS